MIIETTKKFDKSFDLFSNSTKKKFHRQSKHLLLSLRHPSLHAKKYDESGDTWQARVDIDTRFYFQIKKDAYILLDIIKHP